MTIMGNSSQPEVAVRWDQDKHERIVQIAGELSGDAASHLESAIVGVGPRHLVIDLHEVSDIDDACVEVLVDLIRRMGEGQVEIRYQPGDPVARRLETVTDG